MKGLLLLLAVGAFAGGAGCASDRASSRKTTPKEVGMTKEQIIALYGQTNIHRAGDAGETWIYNLNTGEFIPWNVGYRPQMRIIDFGPDGKVKSLSYSK